MVLDHRAFTVIAGHEGVVHLDQASVSGRQQDVLLLGSLLRPDYVRELLLAERGDRSDGRGGRCVERGPE